MTQTEALKLALEALQNSLESPIWRVQCDQAITAIKEALANHIEDNLAMVAQPEQEPACCNGNCPNTKDCEQAMQCLYTTPPQRTWVGLDDDEMLMIYGQQHEGKKYNLGRMVEAKLKEKNK